jgi:hypothetical protein
MPIENQRGQAQGNRISPAGKMCDKSFDLEVIPGISLAFATEVTLENVGNVLRFFAESFPDSPQRREVRQVEERGKKLLVWINLFWNIKAQVRTHALGPLTDRLQVVDFACDPSA